MVVTLTRKDAISSVFPDGYAPVASFQQRDTAESVVTPRRSGIANALGNTKQRSTRDSARSRSLQHCAAHLEDA
ncbi:hypothetical protein B9J09_10690 [Xylella fastidiosa subsp. pauca]|nr:hypothetical protein B9J09_10690 [Xylella fastidiosa subsp. pauca]AVI21437.1 hypothetical protein BCV75_10000 [Xylella fastidiosa]AVI23474.1 hypothetical protein BC375_10065 [Xylella fastidiosa]KIA58650.1 hypothetical protein RA12_03315 [Xylella fastidiosa]KXB10759.1 hypothetical protein ADT32_08435 [Xylella fastidiosa]